MDYAYRRFTEHTFSDTVEAVGRSVAAHGFDILQFHDICGRLAAKGFPIRPLVILEITPADEAQDARLELLMPCRINVYEDGGRVVVAALRPSVFSAIFPEHELDALAAEVDRLVMAIVDAATD
ncbi:MAG: DUF302 domain-containing protein [Actinomycetota bacterium]|nr:DUF302 domain-containing protein [Actinomycetota bacterium]MDZ4179298.1 DUF302 domain-containing protein [Coriobacteriia bacterium]